MEKKKSKKKWIIGTIVLIIVISLIASGNDNNSDVPDSETTKIEQKSEETTEPKLSKKEYKKACKSFSFKDVSRNPDKYKGKLYKIVGEVIQVQESSILFSDDKSLELRVNVTKDKYGYWGDTIYVTYTLASGADRILEDDIITIYGECLGSETYTSVLGSSVTLPSIAAQYIELK